MNLTRHWHWGTRIAIVYVIFAASTVGFVVFAMSRDVDLVSSDYYTAAIAYDARQAAAERALPLASSVAIDNADAGRGRRLTVSFPTTARPEIGSVTLYRAADSRADRSIPINVNNIDNAGRLRIVVDQLPAGPWTVQLTWTSGGQTFYAEHRVVVP